MSYVDGYVLAVPTANKEAYQKTSLITADVLKECGALKLVESWGDDVPEGKLTSFPLAVKLEPDETVVFSWVVWPDRQARDRGTEKAMADPRMQPGTKDMPYDGSRVLYGGFEVLVDESSRQPNTNFYVDGFVLAVPTDNKEVYKKIASEAATVFKSHGALDVVECWGDDIAEGKVTSFPRAVKLEPNETVVFSWITWPSREVRDRGMQKSMEDPRLQTNPEAMPFDGKRMVFGGFQAFIDQ